ncbi:MAG: hypothetical protein MZV64_64130 [Ignavibacteriales bacterium]|nr:hypothetical protein [Ignavibacteriales bacterium]
MVPHERRHARQVRRDPVQAGRDHLRGRRRVPGQRRAGRGRADDGRDLRPPGRPARHRPGPGRAAACRGPTPGPFTPPSGRPGVIVEQGFVREKETLASVRFFVGRDAAAERILAGRLADLDAVRASHLRTIDDLYAARCRSLGVPAAMPAPTKDEIRLAGLVPVRTEKMGGMMAMWGLRDEFRKLGYQAPPSIQMAEMELRNFIDGKRSILDIRDAASAELEPLDLLEVEKWVGVQEKVGLVTDQEEIAAYFANSFSRAGMRSTVFSNSTRGIFLAWEMTVKRPSEFPSLQDEEDGRVGGHGVDRLLVGRVAGRRALGAALHALDVGADDLDPLLAGLGDEGGRPGPARPRSRCRPRPCP